MRYHRGERQRTRAQGLRIASSRFQRPSQIPPHVSPSPSNYASDGATASVFSSERAEFSRITRHHPHQTDSVLFVYVVFLPVLPTHYPGTVTLPAATVSGCPLLDRDTRGWHQPPQPASVVTVYCLTHIVPCHATREGCHILKRAQTIRSTTFSP
ncbi:hypothetical protein B0J13DRAFT_539596 [Dactylonectria estremocensis]|uniref:Uncharacterized protein n=1 Tax=Dactylonectria estremocensis TaxID=1079267 RepID=A0A9P9JC01_9HYPO|nr:hypothetical protein B0J13DRAFT_539596 [Dactylonectria estremocensis]